MDASTVVAIVAVVVGLAAVGVSVWEGITNRRHNRLSVRPALVIYGHNHDRRPLCVLLQNNGFGPAVIKSYAVSVQDRSGQFVQLESPHDLLDNPGLLDVSIWSATPGRVLSVQSEVPLLDFGDSIAFRTDARRDEVAKLRRLEFRIDYESLYGERFSLVDRRFQAVRSR